MISLPLRVIFSIFLMGVAFSSLVSSMEKEEEPYFIVYNTTEREAQFDLGFECRESQTISFERKYRVEIPEGDDHSVFLILILPLIDSETRMPIPKALLNLNIMSVAVRFYDTDFENQITKIVNLKNGRFLKLIEEEDRPNQFSVKLLQLKEDDEAANPK